MLHFQTCPKPEPATLAKNVPIPIEKWTTVYDGTFEHLTYWHQRMEKADTIGDMAVSGVAAQIVSLFGNANKYDYRPPEMRKYLFGLLAQSLLCRHLFGEEMTEIYDIDTSNLSADGIVLEHGIRSREGLPLDPRIHVSGDFIDTFIGPADDGPSTWYRADDLYVRRTALARPSVEFNDLAERRGFELDYSNLQSLFPYIARP